MRGLKTTHIYHLIILEVRDLRWALGTMTTVSQAVLLLGARREDTLPCFLPFLVTSTFSAGGHSPILHLQSSSPWALLPGRPHHLLGPALPRASYEHRFDHTRPSRSIVSSQGPHRKHVQVPGIRRALGTGLALELQLLVFNRERETGARTDPPALPGNGQGGSKTAMEQPGSQERQGF